MDKEDGQHLTPDQRNRLKLKLNIPGTTPSIDREDIKEGDSSRIGELNPNPITPGSAEYYSTQSFMTSSPMPGVAGGNESSIDFGVDPEAARRSSAGHTPGDGSAIDYRALAAHNRVRWTGKELKKKLKHKNSRLSERPGTPFPCPRAIAKETPPTTPVDSPDNWKEIPGIAITPASIQTVHSYEGGSVATASTSAGVDPSPIVSDFCPNEDTPSSSLDNPRSSSSDEVFTTLHRCQAQICLLAPRPNSCRPSSGDPRSSTEGSRSSAGNLQSSTDRDSALSGMEEVSYRSGISGSRSSPRQNEWLTPSSYVRTPRRPSGEHAIASDESGIGSGESNSPGSPRHIVNVTDDGSEGTTSYLMIFMTLALAIATLGTAMCLSIFGPTLPAIHVTTGLTVESTTMLVSSRSAGGIIGILILYRCFDDITPIMSSVLALITSGALTMVIPFINGETSLNVTLFFNGIGLAFFFCASGALSLHIWSTRYMKPTVFTQLFLCLGLILGPTIVLPLLTPLKRSSLENVTSYFPIVENKTVENGSKDIALNLSSSAPTTIHMYQNVLSRIDYTYIYIAAGGVNCLAGILFFIIWILSTEPTFYNRFASFDFLKRNETISGIGSESTRQNAYFYAFVMFGVSMVTIQMGMEATYQNLFMIYITEAMGRYPGRSALYLHIAHYGGLLGGRIIGAAVGIVIGQVPLLMFCGIGTIAAFVTQFLLIGHDEAATWIAPIMVGFCMGAFLPTMVRQMESTVPMSRQVAGGMLGGAFIGMTALPVITGHLMTVYGSQSFHIVLLVESALIFVLLTAFLYIEYQLAEMIHARKYRSKFTDIHVDPNENIISEEDQEGSNGCKKRLQVVDDNGNVVVSRVIKSNEACRTKGEPYTMTSLVSLGSRAVIGRW